MHFSVIDSTKSSISNDSTSDATQKNLDSNGGLDILIEGGSRARSLEWGSRFRLRGNRWIPDNSGYEAVRSCRIRQEGLGARKSNPDPRLESFLNLSFSIPCISLRLSTVMVKATLEKFSAPAFSHNTCLSQV